MHEFFHPTFLLATPVIPIHLINGVFSADAKLVHFTGKGLGIRYEFHRIKLELGGFFQDVLRICVCLLNRICFSGFDGSDAGGLVLGLSLDLFCRF